MITPDDKVLQALIRLEGACPDEYRTVTNWFLKSASKEDEVLRKSESKVAIYRGQGAHKVLMGYLDVASDARKYAEKLRLDRVKTAAAKLAGGSY